MKMFHDLLSDKGFVSRPLMNLFKDGRRVASILARDVSVNSDRETNLKELFSLVVSVKADVIFIGGDTWYVDPDANTVPMHERQRSLFRCIAMHKGADGYRQRSIPYMRDRLGTMYWLVSDKLVTDVDVLDGQVLELMKAVFELNESPYETSSAHAEVLKGFGHAVALWPYGDENGRVELH